MEGDAAIRPALHGIVGGIGFRDIGAGQGAQLAADDVSREAGAEEGAVERGDFVVGDLFICVGAAEEFEFALDAIANNGGFVGLCGGFFEGGVDVAVRDAASAQVPRDPVFALPPYLGPLAGKLFRVARVVDVAILFEAVDDGLDEFFVVGAAAEGSLHFVDRVGAAHEDLDGGFIEGGLGVELARLGEHAGRIEEKVASG